MEIDVATLNFDLNPAIAEYADRRVLAACLKVAGLIEAAIVRLWEVNAGRGGRNKACRIRARLPGRITLVAEAIDVNLHNAIDLAAARFRRALHRHMHDHTTPPEHAHSIGHDAIRFTFIMMEGRHDQASPNPERN